MRLKPSVKVALVVAVVAALALAAFVTYAVRADLAHVRAFKEAHSADKVVGKSTDEIVSLYGEPRSVLRDEHGRVQVIVYNQGWHYCNIVLRDGVAVRVSFDRK